MNVPNKLKINLRYTDGKMIYTCSRKPIVGSEGDYTEFLPEYSYEARKPAIDKHYQEIKDYNLGKRSDRPRFIFKSDGSRYEWAEGLEFSAKELETGIAYVDGMDD